MHTKNFQEHMTPLTHLSVIFQLYVDWVIISQICLQNVILDFSITTTFQGDKKISQTGVKVYRMSNHLEVALTSG